MPTISSHTRKNYVTACANGDIPLIKNLLEKHPVLIGYCPENNKNSLYYSYRNLKVDASLFFIKNGIRLSAPTIRTFISTQWRGSIDSYKFCKKVGKDILSIKELESIDFDDFVYNAYKSFSLSNNKIPRLLSILEYENKLNKSFISSIIQEYEYLKRGNKNPEYISNIRGLKIMMLT